MCFAPQRHALFQHLNFQKWSGAEVFCTFSLRNRLRTTTACNFSSLISPDVSAPAALASLLFDPPEPQNHEKHNVSRLSYLFAHLHLLSSDLFSSDTSPCWLLFHLSILSEVWLLNFLRWYSYGVSVVFLWDFFAGSMLFAFYSMICLWILWAYGMLMVFLWDFYGVTMRFLHDFYWISMMFLWYFCGITFHGISMVFLKDFYAIPMGFLW